MRAANTITSQSGAWFSTFATVVFTLGAILLLLKATVQRPLSSRIAAAVVVTIMLVVIQATSVLSRNGWAEFSAKLGAQAQAGTKIYMTGAPEVSDNEILVAMFDVNAPDGRTAGFLIGSGTDLGEFKLGQRPLMDYFYPKRVYEEYARLRGHGLERFRQYAIVPVDPDSVAHRISEQGYLDLFIADHQPSDVPAGPLVIYGQRASCTSVYIPSPRAVSVEREVHRGDPRIRQKVEILSDSARSYYIDRQSGDPIASDVPGRFNMFLVHFRADGRIDVY
jgi:hypothetical protein